MLRLLLLFTLVPTVELIVLLRIGAWMGPFNTILLVLLTGLLGAWVAKREGLSMVRTLGEDVRRGLPPAQTLVEAALIAGGGLLLITPGVFTDLFGLAMVIPWTRRLMAPAALRWANARFKLDVATARPDEASHPQPGQPRPRDPDQSPFDHPIQ